MRKMKNKKTVKISVVTIFYILVIVMADLIILSGGRADTRSAGMHGAADQTTHETPTQSAALEPVQRQMLEVKNLNVTTKNGEAFYKKGKTLHASCVIKNSTDTDAHGLYLVLRTAYNEIASQKIKTLKSGGEILLQGNFTPTNSGRTVVACRATSEQSSGHEFEDIYVMP